MPRVAKLTLRGVLPDTPERVAVSVVVPGATAVATPLVLTVAMALLEELQLTWVVRFCMDWSV